MIGANKVADIVAQATKLFGPDGVPCDRVARQEALELISDSSEDLLDDLDSQFYAYPDDVESLLKTYLSGAERAG